MLLETIHTSLVPTCLRVFRTSFSQLPMQLYELPVRHFAFYRHAFFQVFDIVSAHWHELPYISPVHVLAFYHMQMGEFLLPYDVVRTANSPDDVLMAFLQSSYEAAATCGKWNRHVLER